MPFLFELISGELGEHERLLGGELAAVQPGGRGSPAGGEGGQGAAQTAARAPAVLQQGHCAPPAVHGGLGSVNGSGRAQVSSCRPTVHHMQVEHDSQIQVNWQWLHIPTGM